MDVTIKNNLATPLINAKVQVLSASPNVDCISDPQALYGTIAAGASATNPPGDRFTFHVAPSVACSDASNPPIARFIVVITGDGFDGSSSLQSFIINLDLDSNAGGAYTYTQNFNTDPGWTTGATPDDSGTCGPYSNNFHWCAACGNGGGGYGAWIGNSAFGTAGQNYPSLDSSTLYSPTFVANGTVGLQFSIAYRTEPVYDGAIAQYALNAGAWTDLAFATPAQAATTSSEFCSPFLANETAWTGTTTGTAWTATNAASVPASVNQTIQFRWRLGSDSSVVGSSYGGLGIDDVSITNLKATVTCEPTRNPGLPGCGPCGGSPNGTPCDDGNACTTGDSCQGGTCSPGSATVCNDNNVCTTDSCNPVSGCVFTNNTNACDDGNGCTVSDICSGGVCSGTPITAPGEASGVLASADHATYTWAALSGATRYDVLRGSLFAFPVGPGGGDESCFNDLPGPTLSDATSPAPGGGFFYLARGENTCGNGSYGTQGVNGAPGAPRSSTTCP
jgi:hypothetical protein